MTLSTFALIYLCFYYVTATLAFFRARQGTAPKIHNSVAAMIIGAVGTLLIYFSSVLSPSGTVPLVFVAAMALVPVFLWGFGNFVGLIVATWRPYLPAQIALGALAIGLPLLLAILAGVQPALPSSTPFPATSEPSAGVENTSEDGDVIPDGSDN